MGTQNDGLVAHPWVQDPQEETPAEASEKRLALDCEFARSIPSYLWAIKVALERRPGLPPSRLQRPAGKVQQNNTVKRDSEGRGTKRVLQKSLIRRLLKIPLFLAIAKATRAISHPFDGTREDASQVTSTNLLEYSRPCGEARTDDPMKGTEAEKANKASGTKKAASQGASRNAIRIISGNIHSLRPRAEVIASWEADIIALQETKLAPTRHLPDGVLGSK